MGNKRPSQSHSSCSSIFPSKTKTKTKTKNNNKKNKKKKDDSLLAKALLHRRQQQQLTLDDRRPILRPKVYITDISNFKKLVQDLTGNNNRVLAVEHPVNPQREQSDEISGYSSSHSDDFKFSGPQHDNEEAAGVLLSYQSETDSVETVHTRATSVESSGTASFNYEEMNSFEQYGYCYVDDQVQMGLYNNNNINMEEDTTSDGKNSLPPLLDDNYMLACQADLEALLEEMDHDHEYFPHAFETNYSSESHQNILHQHHNQDADHDLSIYDYDFTGIVC